MKKRTKIIVLLMVLLLSMPVVAYAKSGFKDVKPDRWYYDYVIRASEMGIISGFTDGTFRPDEVVTRAQLSKIMVEYDSYNAKNKSADERKVINAVANAIPSTVKIASDAGFGSGFFIKSNYIMTNAHVVGKVSTVTVTMSTGEQITGTVTAKDDGKDMALVKVNKSNSFLSLSTELRVGMNAIAIGNPVGQDQTVTKGIVSKLDIKEYKLSNMFQIDTAINAGNSGGAVINSDGKVIGMATGKLLGDPDPIEGIAFAITSVELQRFINQYAK